MLRAFYTLIGPITGYLNGIGLGTLLFSFYPSTSNLCDLEIVLLAALIFGPVGALLGSVMGPEGTHGLISESLVKR